MKEVFLKINFKNRKYIFCILIYYYLFNYSDFILIYCFWDKDWQRLIKWTIQWTNRTVKKNNCNIFNLNHNFVYTYNIIIM